MIAFDELRQADAPSFFRPLVRAMIACVAGCSMAAVAGPAANGRSAERAPALLQLVRADRMRAKALAMADPGRRAAQLVSSVENASRAQGHAFLPGGQAASIDLDMRLSEAREAVAAAGQPAALVARLGNLPGTIRGVSGGRIAQTVRQSGHGPFDLQFEGGQPAIIYARTQYPATLRLIVREAGGRTLCDQARSSGRVLCRWRPIRRQDVLVETQPSDIQAAGTIRLFTN